MTFEPADPVGPDHRSPRFSRELGYAGLIPFIAGAVCLTAAAFRFVEAKDLPAFAAMALVVYGAVILSFLGGVRWGIAVATARADARVFVWSVAPSLGGWCAALLPPSWGLLVLACGFLLQGGWDLYAGESGTLPQWYVTLRRRLTVIVVASLLVSAASLLILLRF
ncbi:DUF3429 domain-containing protein [Stappia sp. ES.058]|uniref:DUF3429 domain-containing protein n=1 Tax=Stappia sp. ES.058 TaxID=1881061 RepID=UPI00087D2E9E|nr:DUF3429 domain-containing protein [Stappia sp. ES.058]SDT94098.1 Protein of unknown function [Stappia sp. ES.058]